MAELITPVVNVKAVSHLIDKFVMVVEWGKTTKQAVLEALKKVKTARERMIGVVLNKANATTLNRFELYRGHNYSSCYHNKSASAQLVCPLKSEGIRNGEEET